VGIVGLGRLGHLAVGADDSAAMAAQNGRCWFNLDTASSAHDPSPYLRALQMDATLCVLGTPDSRATASSSM
jgi:uncharacterized zinc-type alcohol dehydrogenase-like protein